MLRQRREQGLPVRPLQARSAPRSASAHPAPGCALHRSSRSRGARRDGGETPRQNAGSSQRPAAASPLRHQQQVVHRVVAIVGGDAMNRRIGAAAQVLGAFQRPRSGPASGTPPVDGRVGRKSGDPPQTAASGGRPRTASRCCRASPGKAALHWRVCSRGSGRAGSAGSWRNRARRGGDMGTPSCEWG